MEQFLAPGKVVPDGANRQAGLVCNLTQRRTFEPVYGNDPENSVNNVRTPGFGINNFRHYYYLAHLCGNPLILGCGIALGA